MADGWLKELRSIHDASAHRDWVGLAAGVNSRFNLTGPAKLAPSIAGLPPIWFQGNVERIQLGNWVLIMSLNHQRANPGEYAGVTAETSWDMQCQHHRDHWYELFNGALTRLAAAALNTDPDVVDLRAYASDHVIFTELCPYASESFSLKPHEISDLVTSEPAFQIAAEIRAILIEQAQPALVLVNGGSALKPFELAYDDRFTWEGPRKEYPSCDPPPSGRAAKMLWHQEGIYTSPNGPIPVVGFPFLRKPRHHNSYAEIAQLGEHARQWRTLVSARPRQPSA